MYKFQLHTRRMSSNALNFEGWVLQMTFELSKLVHLSTQLYSCKNIRVPLKLYFEVQHSIHKIKLYMIYSDHVSISPTVCPPVAESPPRKFGQLFFGRQSGPSWSDF